MTPINLECISLYNYQIVCLILFFLGLLGVIISRNLIKILICIEFVINSINLLFISFSTYKADVTYIGDTIVLFTTATSVLTLVVGIYLTNLIYKKYGTIDIKKLYQIEKNKQMFSRGEK